MSARTRPLRPATPRLPTRRPTAVIAVAVLVLAAGVGLAYANRERSPALIVPEECRAGYQRARTAADTAVVDALRVGKPGGAELSCGLARIAGGRRGAGGAR